MGARALGLALQSPGTSLFSKMQLTVAFLAAIASQTIATPIARSPYQVRETHYVPKGWQKLDRSHGGKTIQLQIGLKQGRFEELDRHLAEGL